MHDRSYEPELLISNRANGYRDLIAKVDLSTYRRLPWEKNIPFFLCTFTDPNTSKALDVDPRSMLAGIMTRAADMGYKCFAGAEFEASDRTLQCLPRLTFTNSTFNSKRRQIRSRKKVMLASYPSLLAVRAILNHGP